jgi:two-component system cell cycle response regulator
MTPTVQGNLTDRFGQAAAAVRLGLAAARRGQLDVETGLHTRARLLEDLGRLNGVPARLELLALDGGDGVDDVGDIGVDPELPRRIGHLLRAVTEPRGARAYRLDGALYAFLGPVELGSLSPAVSAHGGLAGISMRLASGAVRGEARLPEEAHDAASALRIAHERLRARTRFQRLSAERQVRDVLLQLLSERRAGGSAVALPRVAAHAIGVGRRLGLTLGELDEVVRAAELQDLGMVAVPEAILRKSETLTPEEWQLIRQHPIVGERILAAAPALEPVARLVRSCYERYDGSGYPDGLRGEAIPLGSRVIAVCVAYDAMTSPRPYRPPLPPATAFEELCRCAGRQFDPMVVAAFCAEMNQLDPDLATATRIMA